jgi:hypothetical protein
MLWGPKSNKGHAPQLLTHVCACCCCCVLTLLMLLQMQGISQVSKHAYLKILRDALWPAALDGCGSVSKQPEQQQGQQQQAADCFDAVLAISSPTAGPMLLEGLRAAERQKKARLPVVVQYTVRGGACCGLLPAARVCSASLRSTCQHTGVGAAAAGARPVGLPAGGRGSGPLVTAGRPCDVQPAV